MGFTLAQKLLKPTRLKRHRLHLPSELVPLQRQSRCFVQAMRGPASKLSLERKVGPLLKAQSLSNPSPPSDTTVGCMLKGPSGLGQNLRGTKPSGMEVWSRRKENAARKGKAPVVQMRDSMQEEETIVSKKTWSTLFPPSVNLR